MKNYLIALLLIISVLTLVGCNTVTREFGGTMDLEIPANMKLVNITWKENTIWYLTKPMTSTDVAESYVFKAKSNFGVFEGQVNIKESKTK